MQLYTENEKKITVLLSTFGVDNIVLYKSCVCCKHKTSLVRCSDYFREQYYAFRNQLRALVQKISAKKKFVQMCMRHRYSRAIYKACCPSHFHYRKSCYPCHFIFSSELDMSVLSTSFKFGRAASP